MIPRMNGNGANGTNGQDGHLLPPAPPPSPPHRELVLELVQAVEELFGSGITSAEEWRRRYEAAGRLAKKVREALGP